METADVVVQQQLQHVQALLSFLMNTTPTVARWALQHPSQYEQRMQQLQYIDQMLCDTITHVTRGGV